MVLPAPNLDDRAFQDLVDEAKRMVQLRCPSWTDHNVSDPGVTLIEAFATMVDQLIYRLNRVPDRHYIKFLDLVGVQLRPPSAARGEATFWLSAPQPQPVNVRAETEVATPRTDVDDPIVFTTLNELRIVPCRFHAVASAPVGGGAPVSMTAKLGSGEGFPSFVRDGSGDDRGIPQTGAAMLVGLSAAVPHCAVVIRLDCWVAGVGVDPQNPPLVWEALTPAGWVACEMDRDESGGLNRPGDVVLHVPGGHQMSVINSERAGWLRCRLIEAESGQPTYTESPRIRSISAFTIGGTTRIVHAEVVRDEQIGRSDGTPGQRFSLQHHPVVPWDDVEREPPGLFAVDDDGVSTWAQVEHFAQAGPTDKVYQLDPFAGEVNFGPAVREADGTLRCYGAIPPKGAHLRLASYRTGGGSGGNVTIGAIRVLKTSVPYVTRVENRTPAVGGADAESLADAKVRAPLLLRARGRAVTADDYVDLTREVAPEIARVHCVAGETGPDARGVRVLLVPALQRDELGRVRPADLQPLPESLTRITSHLAERKVLGTRLVVEPPEYRWLTVAVQVSARPNFRAEDVRIDVLRALYRLFDPVIGGDGRGWAFGRPVLAHEVNAALSQVRGVDLAEEVSIRLFPADPGSGRRGAEIPRLAVPATGLVCSYEHQVRVRG